VHLVGTSILALSELFPYTRLVPHLLTTNSLTYTGSEFSPKYIYERRTTFIINGLYFFSHSCTVHLDTIESFIYPTDAQLDCSIRMLKFTLKFT